MQVLNAQAAKQGRPEGDNKEGGGHDRIALYGAATSMLLIFFSIGGLVVCLEDATPWCAGSAAVGDGARAFCK